MGPSEVTEESRERLLDRSLSRDTTRRLLARVDHRTLEGSDLTFTPGTSSESARIRNRTLMGNLPGDALLGSVRGGCP